MKREAMNHELQSARENIAQLQAAAVAAAAAREEAVAAAAAAQEMAVAAAVAEAQQAAAAAAAAAAMAGGMQNDLPPVPKPTGRNLRGLEALSGMTRADYKAVQRSIRNLVVMANLDWKEDFRRQNAENLARLYRVARDEHPILRRFQNSWLTAELVKQFLQNKRKYAVKQGYIDRESLKTARRNV
ncbi:hypothetical protein C8Q73DRAFT_161502 [Cubamyces lactineus]|nr:hypothetical protein C8Q73DRAFT_161502 [Cubamyces lactineus]